MKTRCRLQPASKRPAVKTTTNQIGEEQAKTLALKRNPNTNEESRREEKTATPIGHAQTRRENEDESNPRRRSEETRRETK